MKQAGEIVLIPFPRSDLAAGKWRPAVLLTKLPGVHDDLLACMISSQLKNFSPGFDDIIQDSDKDFGASGLKSTSLVRVGRVAVIANEIFRGAIGAIGQDRLIRIRSNLSRWIRDGY